MTPATRRCAAPLLVVWLLPFGSCGAATPEPGAGSASRADHAASAGALLASPAPDQARLAFELINESRRAERLAPLQADAQLEAFALERARTLAATGEMTHSSLETLRQAADGLVAWAENIGFGPDLRELHQRLLQSPNHRNNILGPFTLVGVGVVKGDVKRYYVVVVFGRR